MEKLNSQGKQIEEIKALLTQAVTVPQEKRAIFFKTGTGDYAEHEQFIGVTVPALRKIAQSFSRLPKSAIAFLIRSPINEERLLALLILLKQYQQGNNFQKNECYHFYLENLAWVNNWNLVDASAALILGAHIYEGDKSILLELAHAASVWKRRIAMVATHYFIRHHAFDWTLRLAKQLLNDSHDLIQKAVGWMLREVGKHNIGSLTGFLDHHATGMPRTMLRYAIEKFPSTQRQAYLKIPRPRTRGCTYPGET